MVLVQRSKLLYAVAGSGVVLGFFSYFQSEKKTVKLARTNNFVPSVKWDYNWDNRDFSKIIKPSDENDPVQQNRMNEQKMKEVPTARRHIFLIRHGQYDLEAKTDSDSHLTELGRRQAESVGQRLKDMKFNYTKMVRSTMTRALETSDIVLKYFPNLPVESCDSLREGAPIEPDPPLDSWKVPDEQYRKDGLRIEGAFRKYFHRADVNQKSDSFEIVVCHGNVIRYFVCRLLQFPPQAWLRFQMLHCSITWVVILPSGKVHVCAVGDSGFMPKDIMTA